jgi:putative selenium metabolism hydrolase
MKKRVLESAAAAEGALARFLGDIVSIPSPSRGEKAVAGRVAEEMERLGFDEIRFDGLGSVIGRIGSGERILVLDGHIDTVDVGNPDLWEFDPYSGAIVDGHVLGRGAADQKGGVASMIHAGAIMKNLSLLGPFTIYMTGTVMEEDCDGLCWQYLIDEEGLVPDFAVITEPTDLGVYRGQRGRMEIEVIVPGVSAHGSAPERGENAVTKTAPLVMEIDALDKRLPEDPFLGKGSVAVTRIASTSPSVCAIPDACSIHLDRRLTGGETEASALAEIESLAADVPGARVEVLEYDGKAYTGRSYPARKTYPAWTTEPGHVLVRAAEGTYRSLFGSPARVGRWSFSTNGTAISGMKGIPCVGFGPGHEAMAHAPNERIPVDHLVRACAFCALFPMILADKLAASP